MQPSVYKALFNGWEKQKKVSVSVVGRIKQEIFGSVSIVGGKTVKRKALCQ